MTGVKQAASCFHISPIIAANAFATLPFEPKGFSIFTALLHLPSVKNRVNGTVAFRHWIVAFI